MMPAALQVLKATHNKVTQLAVLAGCSSLKVGLRQAHICLSLCLEPAGTLISCPRG